MKKLSVVIVIAIVSFSVAGSAVAQDTTGTLSGRMVDTQGLALPGVTVTAFGPQGAKTTVTDGEGRFRVAFLTPGTYAVHADLSGFAPIDRRDVQVRLGQTVEVLLTMQVGGLEETIEVVAPAPTLDTTNTTIGVGLDSATLSRLPVGRRFSDTLYLAPGRKHRWQCRRGQPVD